MKKYLYAGIIAVVLLVCGIIVIGRSDAPAQRVDTTDPAPTTIAQTEDSDVQETVDWGVWSKEIPDEPEEETEETVVEATQETTAPTTLPIAPKGEDPNFSVETPED